MEEVTHKLFVRNLPFTTTNEELEALFENDGPLKKCFVVSRKGTPMKCQGFGFVTFALKEDADKVLQSEKELGGRKLQLLYATRKSEDSPKGVKRKSEPLDAFGKADVKFIDKKSNKPLGSTPHPGKVGKGDLKSSRLLTGTPKKKMKFVKNDDDDDDDDDNDDDDDDDDDDGDSNVDDGSDVGDTDDNSDSEDEDNTEENGLKDNNSEDSDDDKDEDDKAMSASTENVQKGQKGKINTGNKLSQKTPKTPKKKEAKRLDDDRTLFIRNYQSLSDEEDVKSFFAQYGTVDSFELLKRHKRGKDMGFITFSTQVMATKCLEAANIKKSPLLYKGKPMKVAKANNTGNIKQQLKIAQENLKNDQPGQSGRLILRNLPWKLNEKVLRNEFKKFGEIKDVYLRLKTGSNDCVGYGFIEYVNGQDAASAIKAMNGQNFLGRVLAIDVAIPKSEYRELKKRHDQIELTKARDQMPKEANSADKNNQNGDDDKTEDSDEVEDSENGTDDEEDEDDNVEDSNDEMDDEGKDEDEEDDDDDDDEDDEDEDDESKYDGKGSSVDVKEERTLFIRNLSFETENGEIQKLFSQFGAIKVCSIVKDSATDQSKGSAFIQFATKEAAEKCIRTAKTESSLRLHDRQLEVAKALSREEATTLQEKRKKLDKMVEKDKRNSYLLREGFIRPGTQDAAGISKSDQVKRSKVEEVKRIKMKDINVYVSKTRLVVHNLPMSVDDKQLKNLFQSAVKNAKGVHVTEARVMKDKQNPTADGKFKPLGYAFVEFSEHIHALEALRNVNNNEELFGPNRRPIVGFSLENRKALESRKRRLEKSKQGILNKDPEGVRKPGNKSANNNPSPKLDLDVDPRLNSPTSMSKGFTKHARAKLRWRDKGKRATEERTVRKERRRKMTIQQGGQREPQGRMERVPVGNQNVGSTSPTKKKRVSRDRAEEGKFDSLVKQYKKKLSSPGFGNESSKWYE